MHDVIYNRGSFKRNQLRGCLKSMYDLENYPISNRGNFLCRKKWCCLVDFFGIMCYNSHKHIKRRHCYAGN